MKFTTPNKGFIFPAIFFFVFIGVLLLNTEQGFGLRFCSENRNEFWNLFFMYGTKLGEEFIYIFITIIGLFISWRFVIKIPFIGFSIMGVSHLLKRLFQHRRPYQYYGELQQMDNFNILEGVHLLMGYSSFPSGHTMSGFGLFYLLSLHFNKNILVGVLCFLLAMIIGISRVYLFQHFLKDIFVGGIIGILVAHIVDYLFSYMKPKINPQHP